jgi:hypothetical protein
LEEHINQFFEDTNSAQIIWDRICELTISQVENTREKYIIDLQNKLYFFELGFGPKGLEKIELIGQAIQALSVN